MLFDSNYFNNLTEYLKLLNKISQEKKSIKEVDECKSLNKSHIDILEIKKEKENELEGNKQKEDVDELSKFEDQIEINLDEYTQFYPNIKNSNEKVNEFKNVLQNKDVENCEIAKINDLNIKRQDIDHPLNQTGI